MEIQEKTHKILDIRCEIKNKASDFYTTKFTSLITFFKRNLSEMQYRLGQLMPSIVFPACCFGLIFLDWNHTRNWKNQNILMMAALQAAARKNQLE